MTHRLLTLLFLFCSFLYSNTLQQTYPYKNPIIYSSDLASGCPKRFEVLRIPEDKTSFRINAQVIAKTYELNGCTIDVGNIRFVNFVKQSGIDLSVLKTQVSTLFLSNYPNMSIDQITLFPRGFIDVLPTDARAVFDPDTHLKKEGTFYIVDKNGIRRYFDFSMDATLSVLHSSQKIARKEVLSPSNTKSKLIPFVSFRGKPLISLPPLNYRFRSSLREDVPILDRNIEPLPIVLKGSKVSVQVQNDSVVVEFIATATQEGALYDIITIQKADGKRSRAKVIGDNQVELQ